LPPAEAVVSRKPKGGGCGTLLSKDAEKRKTMLEVVEIKPGNRRNPPPLGKGLSIDWAKKRPKKEGED